MEQATTTSPSLIESAAAWGAARLPSILGLHYRIMGNEWYKHNGYFKYKPGEVLVGPDSDYPNGVAEFRVIGYDKSKVSKSDIYVVERSSDSQRYTIHKWNVEYHFRSRDSASDAHHD